MKLCSALARDLKEYEQLASHVTIYGLANFLEDRIKKYYREQKPNHEEIKKMAWGMLEKFLTSGTKLKVNKRKIIATRDFIKFCWCRAEEFYNYAKEQEETNDEI